MTRSTALFLRVIAFLGLSGALALSVMDTEMQKKAAKYVDDLKEYAIENSIDLTNVKANNCEMHLLNNQLDILQKQDPTSTAYLELSTNPFSDELQVDVVVYKKNQDSTEISGKKLFL